MVDTQPSLGVERTPGTSVSWLFWDLTSATFGCVGLRLELIVGMTFEKMI